LIQACVLDPDLRHHYGGLGALRGDNQAHSLSRRDSAVTIAVLIPVAWHIGGLAGYL